ncbi:MAG: hypothetical protein WHT65_09145, partial [Pseudothermotoga sp.]
SGYSRVSFSDGMICLVRSQPASVLVLTESGKVISEISIGLSYPVNAVHKAGVVFVSDYYKASVMVYTIFGRLLKRINVGPYPTTIKLIGTKLYVSCSGDSSVYRIDSFSQEVEAKSSFKSASLYFEVFGDQLLYLYYFDTDKTYERTGQSSKTVKVNNLKNPVEYVEKGGYGYLLGYTDGMLVCLKNDLEVWRVNLSDFARDMVLTEKYIVVTSLLDPIATFVSYDGKVLKKIQLPNVTHRVLYVDNKFVFLNHSPGEVYIVDQFGDSMQTVKVGSYAVEMVQISEYQIAVLCSDSGELYWIDLRGTSP